MPYRLAIITSHPIQYQVPLFKKISEHPDICLTVYFRSKKGVEAPYYDTEFGKEVKWEIPLLEGYSYRFLSGPLGLVRELHASLYDALMLYGWNSWLNLFAFAFARIRGIRIFMYGESPFCQEAKKRGPLQIIKRIFLRALFTGVSAFLYIGEENRKFYEWLGVPEKKLFYTPYAVDNERWGQGIKSTNHKPTVLFVGKLIPKKRPLDLIRAFTSLQEKGELLIVGDGVLRNELEEYVRKEGIQNIRFAGLVSQETLSRYYGEADIFMLPSDMGETWGLVVNEAMNFSLPVVVSGIVGCAEDLARHGENGFVYRVGNVEELQKYLETLLESKDRRESFGKRSKRIVEEFSYEKDVEGIMQALSA